MKGETIVSAQRVLPVREHGNLVRTPLAVFFNSPTLEPSTREDKP